jgi:hypothetical protein
MTIKPGRRSNAWRGGGPRKLKIEQWWPVIKAANIKGE